MDEYPKRIYVKGIGKMVGVTVGTAKEEAEWLAEPADPAPAPEPEPAAPAAEEA